LDIRNVTVQVGP